MITIIKLYKKIGKRKIHIYRMKLCLIFLKGQEHFYKDLEMAST